MTGYLLDTNIVNRLRDGRIDPQAMRGLPIFVTHVQRNELEQTPDIRLRQLLLDEISGIDEIPTSSMVFDVSEWDRSEFTSDAARFVEIHEAIMARDILDKKRSKEPKNQIRDALIAETALQKGLVFVTDDNGLRAVAQSFGARAISSGELAGEPRPATAQPTPAVME